MREYFFGSCLVIEEKNLIRIRVPAGPGTLLKLRAGELEQEGEMGDDASVLVTVNAPGGSPGDFPFDEELDVTYDPYIEFFFVGGSELFKHKVGEREGLLVRSGGALAMADPTNAMPFSLGQLVEAGRLEVSADEGESGPHFPKREIQRGE